MPEAEQVRPCLRCGAWFAAEAEVCPACGTQSAAVAGSGLCLSCGAILADARNSCPHCGAQVGIEAADSDRVKACVRCESLIPYSQLYCGDCGELSVPVRVEGIAAEPRVDSVPAHLNAAIGAALLLTTAGIVCLGVAAIEGLR